MTGATKARIELGKDSKRRQGESTGIDDPDEKAVALLEKHRLITSDDTPIPAGMEELWAKVESSEKISDRMKRSLRRVVCGETYRMASAAEGYANWKEVWVHARNIGIAAANKSKLVDGSKRIAMLAQEEMERRLTDEADSLSPRDVAITGAIYLDKVANAEGWNRANSSSGDFVSELARIAEKFEDGGSVKLELSVTPGNDVIDVTPTTEK